jgi:hypothetical protein
MAVSPADVMVMETLPSKARAVVMETTAKRQADAIRKNETYDFMAWTDFVEVRLRLRPVWR